MLTITKKSAKTWVHSENGVILPFILSKFYFSIDGDNFRIIERGGSRRNAWRFNNITIVDEVANQTYTGFTSTVELSERLELLRYPAFDFTSEGGIESVQAGENVTVDNTDPQNPIINVPDIPSGGVESVTGNIVDNTDPANPTVNFNAGDYDLEDFNNGSSDPFVRESELPEGLDQDNLPIPIDLTLADLGLTEVGTDEEMNDAYKVYFTANPRPINQKQIPHIRLFDELPSSEPYLRLEFNDITILEDYGVTDLNDVEQWNGFLSGSEFESVEVNGNVAELRGGTTEFINVASALDPFDLIDFDVRNISGALSLYIEDNNTFSLDAIKITNCPNTTEISYNACPENITVLPASISNMPDLTDLAITGNNNGIETIELGALNGCTSLLNVVLSPNEPNNLTATQLDNIANWAENDAPNDGFMQLSTNEDISGSATIGFLTAKGWTIDNNI